MGSLAPGSRNWIATFPVTQPRARSTPRARPECTEAALAELSVGAWPASMPDAMAFTTSEPLAVVVQQASCQSPVNGCVPAAAGERVLGRWPLSRTTALSQSWAERPVSARAAIALSVDANSRGPLLAGAGGAALDATLGGQGVRDAEPGLTNPRRCSRRQRGRTGLELTVVHRGALVGGNLVECRPHVKWQREEEGSKSRLGVSPEIVFGNWVTWGSHTQDQMSS